jgi:DNA-binding MarR family transcriptional regulator
MPTEPQWLDAREDRAWRAFMHAHYQLNACLNRRLLQYCGLSDSDYEVLAVLSGRPEGRMPAQEMRTQLGWEKSRLSHQVRRMEEQGLVAREFNPADRRSAMIVLLPPGRRAIEGAAPEHVRDVRRHMIDLFTPAELDTLAGLHERILNHLAAEPCAEAVARGQSSPGVVAGAASPER